MKRILAAFAALTLTLPLIAEETQRYLIVTRDNPAASRLEVAANAEMAESRRVRTFRNFNALAADLTPTEAAELRASGVVVSIEPVLERFALQTEAAAPAIPTYEKQVVPWGVAAINAAGVWPVTRGRNVNVVVIDTGIDFTHPDLAAAYAGGYNVLDPKLPPADDSMHGTHVAGIIAAADNAFGVIGVAPGVKLWAVKVLDRDGRGTSEGVAAAVDWVIQQSKERGGRWVINLSLGAGGASTVEQLAIERAITANVIVVAAAGNSGLPSILYPAGYPGVIAVGAIDEQTRRAEFSSYGNGISTMAPGVEIPSTLTKGINNFADLRSGSDTLRAWPLIGTPFDVVKGELVDCGYGRPEDFPWDVRGRIALIQRGEAVPFRVKARNAKEAGAAAVVIWNNEEEGGSEYWTMVIFCTGGCKPDPEWDGYEFPLTIGVPKKTGERLLAAKGEVTVGYRTIPYGAFNGTSMATPHTAGVAALLLALAPDLGPATLKMVIEQTATDIHDEGWDNETGWGVIDALAAAHYVAPDKFGVPPPAKKPRRRAVR